jgi:hypothetical protein
MPVKVKRASVTRYFPFSGQNILVAIVYKHIIKHGITPQVVDIII